ncbi:ABC transporter ATP-binding protein [Paracoccus saliphilus]|uniref:Spermidine/putrescine import ATP-binding protein PotA n=1 Tax=Paracoccus saliphilus TaxID=405559 RepID=A0AA46A4U3_9RHOB|nr:ABC transporter ATP-binding protein [Paracoccus saliphilus]WCR01410.1 ABC transporter ATP-binding protein [Paracoccus saliphilus]SIS69845.1 putative spermidine/putrescine transport system ATP-binding protein [Paracoccus saliphilus]
MLDVTPGGHGHVVLSAITKSYDGRHLVVRDLNLSIRKGEFLTLLGPSGSGKTTTLMMLAGFEYPTSGEIRIDGAPVHAMPPEKRNIGMVFQNYALFPHMTVAENIGYGLKVRRVSKTEIDRRVRAVLETVHLAELADRRPGMLSGGQQQRVALARALVFEPSIVLMDEPLGALDKKLREHLQFEIRQIAQRFNLTVIYVTHDQYEALTMSDRIAIFNDGQVQQLGSAEEIYARPVNRFVAEFVGDNNCLRGRVTAVQDERASLKLENGTIIYARTTEHVRPGSMSTSVIRPEALRMSDQPFEGAMEAIVSDSIFCGDQTRTVVELAGKESLVVKSAAHSEAIHPIKGQTVHVGWAWEDAWALDA